MARCAGGSCQRGPTGRHRLPRQRTRDEKTRTGQPERAGNSRRDSTVIRSPLKVGDSRSEVDCPPATLTRSRTRQRPCSCAVACAVVRPIVISEVKVAKSVISSLRDTHRRLPRQSGLHLIQPRGEAGAEALASWRLRLAPGESATFSSADEEAVVVLQEGRAIWSAGAESWTVGRRGVFDERATALYLPPGTTFTGQGLDGSGHPDVSRRSSSARRRRAAAPPRCSALTPSTCSSAAAAPAAAPCTISSSPISRPAVSRSARRSIRPGTGQLPAAQARRPRRRAPARGDLPLPDRPPQGFGHQMRTTHGSRSPHRARWRRRRPALRLPSRVGAARLSALLSLGDGGRRAESWRSSKIRPTHGFTRHDTRRHPARDLRRPRHGAAGRTRSVGRDRPWNSSTTAGSSAFSG